MYNKVILIQVDSIIKYPPTIALISELVNEGVNVTVLTTIVNDQLTKVLPKSVIIKRIGNEYAYNTHPLKKLKDLFCIRKNIWRYIDGHYKDDTLLWVMSNITIKHMGMRLLNYRFNLHLFELVEKVAYIGSHSFDLDLNKLANAANKVIVCEYNRAQITKTWFKLKELPLIISNKPQINNLKRNSEITKSDNAKRMIEQFKDKKIILYQGVVDKERPIEIIAHAVEKLDDDFVFIIMTGSPCTHLEKYKKTIVIPYIAAPFHLEVTSHAFVGILIYTPVYDSFTSPLNSIYCAPNKIYEFSQFGIPMIGNDIPGLKYSIEYNHMGVCISDINDESFAYAIRNIDKNYDMYSKNAIVFYNNNNNQQIVRQALMKK